MTFRSDLPQGPPRGRTLFPEEHEQLRRSFRRWLDETVVPHLDEWDRAGIMPREVLASAGAHGFLGMAVPEEHGGGGVSDSGSTW